MKLRLVVVVVVVVVVLAEAAEGGGSDVAAAAANEHVMCLLAEDEETEDKVVLHAVVGMLYVAKVLGCLGTCTLLLFALSCCKHVYRPYNNNGTQ
jgi:hypothetical protein